MTAAVILAAGASTRLGSPKQLVEFHGETLLDRSIRTTREAGCLPIIVVLGSSARLIEQHCNLHHVTVLCNEDWREGMASSIRLGVASLSRTATRGAVILPCDMPAITPAHLRALTATEVETASRYESKNGIPAFFPRESFPALLALEGDKGARELLQHAPFVELPNGALDIDTPLDLARLLPGVHSGVED